MIIINEQEKGRIRKEINRQREMMGLSFPTESNDETIYEGNLLNEAIGRDITKDISKKEINMKKTKLRESELKRIVKKIITEKQLLMEADKCEIYEEGSDPADSCTKAGTKCMPNPDSGFDNCCMDSNYQCRGGGKIVNYSDWVRADYDREIMYEREDREVTADAKKIYVCVKGDCYKKDDTNVPCGGDGWGNGGKCFSSKRKCNKNC